MGIDFIERAAKSFKKCWDRSLVDLGTADLFTRLPNEEPRAVTADLKIGARVSSGSTVNVEVSGCSLVLTIGNHEVGEVVNPPREVFDAVVNSHGIACGRIEQIYHLTGTAELTLS